jgi:hypothetical protein
MASITPQEAKQIAEEAYISGWFRNRKLAPHHCREACPLSNFRSDLAETKDYTKGE